MIHQSCDETKLIPLLSFQTLFLLGAQPEMSRKPSKLNTECECQDAIFLDTHTSAGASLLRWAYTFKKSLMETNQQLLDFCQKSNISTSHLYDTPCHSNVHLCK